jgi:hypothetical protein
MAFVEKSKTVMDRYEKVRLFLDQDFTGEGRTRLGLFWGRKFQDESGPYAGHKDLNEFIQSVGKAQKRGYRPGLK